MIQHERMRRLLIHHMALIEYQSSLMEVSILLLLLLLLLNSLKSSMDCVIFLTREGGKHPWMLWEAPYSTQSAVQSPSTEDKSSELKRVAPPSRLPLDR